MISINLKELTISINKESVIENNASLYKLPKWFKGIYFFVFLLSLGSWLFYYLNGLILSYNDARSHLDVARRVVDSLTPGAAQIGSVWLPLQHILELTTIWNNFMFRTGLSGSIISMFAFVASAIFMIKIARLLSLDYLAILIMLMTFALNPNLLFLQSIPMTESLLLFTLLGTLYYFAKWIKTNQMSSLILSGVFTFLAVLTRYDGWFLFLFLALATFIISYIRNNAKKAESDFLIYSSLGFFAVALWLGWNLLIFGDPLFFLNSQFSAKAQQDILLSEGRLLTRFNLPFSTEVFGLAIIANTSLVIFILGVIGIIKSFISNTSFTVKILIFSFLAPIIFNIISLFLGQSVIHLPNLPPYTYFNIRYGIMALPVIALGVGFFVNKRKFAALIVAILILFQYGNMYLTNNIITIQDGVRGSSGAFLDDVGSWVHNNASKGLILVPASSHDALIFISDLPLNHFITEGSGKYWKTSLKDPTIYANFVIMHQGDLVYDSLYNNKKFLNNYHLVFQGEFSNVYKKNTNLGT